MGNLGEPDDVAGECNAHFHVGDNFGDNSATMRCQLAFGHQGDHRETWREGRVVLTWARQDALCNKCHGDGTVFDPDAEDINDVDYEAPKCETCGGTGEFAHPDPPLIVPGTPVAQLLGPLIMSGEISESLRAAAKRAVAAMEQRRASKMAVGEVEAWAEGLAEQICREVEEAEAQTKAKK